MFSAFFTKNPYLEIDLLVNNRIVTLYYCWIDCLDLNENLINPPVHCVGSIHMIAIPGFCQLKCL